MTYTFFLLSHQKNHVNASDFERYLIKIFLNALYGKFVEVEEKEIIQRYTQGKEFKVIRVLEPEEIKKKCLRYL
jgi:hypothetical protein